MCGANGPWLFATHALLAFELYLAGIETSDGVWSGGSGEGLDTVPLREDIVTPVVGVPCPRETGGGGGGQREVEVLSVRLAT